MFLKIYCCVRLYYISSVQCTLYLIVGFSERKKCIRNLAARGVNKRWNVHGTMVPACKYVCWISKTYKPWRNLITWQPPAVNEMLNCYTCRWNKAPGPKYRDWRWPNTPEWIGFIYLLSKWWWRRLVWFRTRVLFT